MSTTLYTFADMNDINQVTRFNDWQKQKFMAQLPSLVDMCVYDTLGVQKI